MNEQSAVSSQHSAVSIQTDAGFPIAVQWVSAAQRTADSSLRSEWQVL